ncbi:hypothetical protein [Nocardiopsis lambiniae]|uniref:Uncharacterized protein n=1 Tax=Nocardiopsis lambiniae TaxID=3075539 RepID=A0ABU2MHB9_9ACTN|nr:hypothetical protein [Nocardiopsis sp. DSM 44743]MDT0332102.1 hypothetical protein [Nocardiopsis sp. DSM 44743]
MIRRFFAVGMIGKAIVALPPPPQGSGERRPSAVSRRLTAELGHGDAGVEEPARARPALDGPVMAAREVVRGARSRA